MIFLPTKGYIEEIANVNTNTISTNYNNTINLQNSLTKKEKPYHFLAKN